MGDVSDELEHDAHGQHGRLTARRVGKRRALAALCGAFALLFLWLALWQVERRAWKLDLIAAVSARVDARASAAPGPARWPAITAERYAYRHVQVAGRYEHARATRVTAVTGRGEGAWLLTPLRTDAGWTVLINRGLVPAGIKRVSEPSGRVVVRGLLRATEPGGQWLRANVPRQERWYSRDVAAIAAQRGLRDVAPYFVDAEASGAGYPMGGLTVVNFRNAHLSYALTWSVLAAFCCWACWRVLKER